MATGTLTIDLDAIAANWRALDRQSGAGVQTAAVVKASNEWADKQAATNPWCKKAFEHQSAFMKSVKPISEFRFATGSR